jgi:hypothetical protein
MHVLITTVTLVLLTLVVFLLRIFWLQIPSSVRSLLIRAAIAIVIVHILFTVTKWETTSDRVNVIVKWFAVAGYELLLMLFSRLSPKWLTSISAFILLVPIFASSILLPLTPVFNPTMIKLQRIGNDLVYQKVPWGDTRDTETNSGVELIVYRLPHLAPFLRHNLQTITFNNQQCDTSTSFVVAGPDSQSALARCPRWPTQGAGYDDRVMSLH